MKIFICIGLAVICTFVGAASVSADDLTGTMWNWTGSKTPAGATSVPNPANYTLDFQEGGKVAVKADCNTGNGTYKLVGKKITFGPMAMTRMMCQPGSLDTKFLQGLAASDTYEKSAAVMTINFASGAGTMAFTRVSGNPLLNTKWKWDGTQTPVEAITPKVPANYTLEFLAGKVNVKADCNTGSGSYTVNGSSISFGPMAMTRMMCQPESLDTKFLQQLAAARTFKVEDGKLMMDLVADGGTMQFSSVGPTASNPLVGSAWNWISTQTPTGKVTVADPTNYTLAFVSATVAAVKADCNKGNGSYTVDGTSIKFGPMAMTMMACPPGSLDSTFNRQLGAASTYKIIGDRLTIELAENGGTMTFSAPKPAHALVATAWNWVSSQSPTGDVSVPTSKNYSVAFLTDTRSAVQADCNKGNGSYTVEGNTIKFGNMAMTMMACPPGSMDTMFMRQLGSASTFKIVGDRLTFEIGGGGSMNFVRAAK